MSDMVQFYKGNEDNFSIGKVKLDVASMIGKETVFDPSKYGSAVSDEKPRKKKTNINGVEVVTAQDDTSGFPGSASFKESYSETDGILKGAIMQLDMVANDLTHDLKEIRSSKTLRNKYEYIGNMTGSLSSIISSKISAARELNNSIKNAHDLEFKARKEFKIGQEDVDDTKAIMDTYNAFVSMPVSANPLGYSTPIGPNTSDLTLMGANMLANAIGANPDTGYNNYLMNMRPEQAMMMYENNPDIKQVVLYNQDTFQKSFEIMNTKTGEILQGLPKRNTSMYMPDTVIDINNKVARNVNLDEVYDVVIVGKGDLSQY